MASTIKNRKQEESKVKFYHVQFYRSLDPMSYTEIVVTRDINAWKEKAEKYGGLFVVFTKELTEEEAMNGQKYYPVVLSL